MGIFNIWKFSPEKNILYFIFKIHIEKHEYNEFEVILRFEICIRHNAEGFGINIFSEIFIYQLLSVISMKGLNSNTKSAQISTNVCHMVSKYRKG